MGGKHVREAQLVDKDSPTLDHNVQNAISTLLDNTERLMVKTERRSQSDFEGNAGIPNLAKTQ